MINLAGNKDCDKYIIDELERAGINVIKAGYHTHEVPYHYEGSLENGMLKFSRAWYYWIAVGKVPRNVAEKIYAHPEGKKTVRIGGHCGCPAPSEYGLTWFDKATGQIIMSEKEYAFAIEAYGKYDDFVNKLNKDYIIDNGQSKEQFATCYHIDDQAGLLLFSMLMREYYAKQEEY
jgi:hypothetical protein